MKIVLSNEELKAIRTSIVENNSIEGLELYNKIMKNEEESIIVSRINESEVCMNFDVDTTEAITKFGPLVFEFVGEYKEHGFTASSVPKIISLVKRCKELI